MRLLVGFVTGEGLIARATVLAVLALALKIPLGMVGGVVADRQNYESEAVRSVTMAWGGNQTF
ncbi:MAG: inner membrane CreD family protein, partial [Alphaproteobacteria bacterium]|nr:inner membrane CreD family protein [Alphaproteobacteria bacterium]